MHSRPEPRHGFTLVELLVVIGIIAILAATLFPVFAQARTNARAVACLSNIKQIGTSLLMYTQDYDERFPTVGRNVDGYGDPQRGDMVVRLQPYLKNTAVFFCPDRNSTYSSFGTYSWNPGNRQLGYGSNFGLWSIGDSIGMFLGWPADYYACAYDPWCAVGHSLAEVTAPSDFILMGDTFDYPYYSLSLAYQSTDGTGTDNIRHHRMWNYVRADGHVRPTPVAPYKTSETWDYSFTVMPRRLEDIEAMCIDENVISAIYHQSCGQMAEEIARYRKEL